MAQKIDLFINRDISWLSFNKRLLIEAANDDLPLLERLKFLSIFSSNLDEFYRVRMPAIRAIHKIGKKQGETLEAYSAPDVIEEVNATIGRHQRFFGEVLRQILAKLKDHRVRIVHNEDIPAELQQETSDYFFNHLLAFLHIVPLDVEASFFPENNTLYFLTTNNDQSKKSKRYIVTIPSHHVPRFFRSEIGNEVNILFIDDIIRNNLQKIPGYSDLTAAYSFKVTRDAEIEIADEYEGDLAEKIERQIVKRDFGLATRLLYDSTLPAQEREELLDFLKLEKVTLVEGGRYHNLKDFSDLPAKEPSLTNLKWKPLLLNIPEDKLLLKVVEEKDILINTPYQSYESVVRFFNEAALDPGVQNIYITVYRLAQDSRIANALITAAKNGKKVSVFVELKARFDEANNIKWSKKMKAAGIKIIYSIPSLKVHAKIALVSRKDSTSLGILATGNFNEVTASIYTDHVLLTSNPALLLEMEELFLFLEKRRKPLKGEIKFKHLLVAQFNLKRRFAEMIEREIQHATNGHQAGITIKLNNLEEEGLISLLYKASQAGVGITLIVRGICRLIPGIAGLSENITVTRIVDRYLEHGRIFVFSNDGDTEVYMGSADWMFRNIYRRIEVCFPIYEANIKQTLLTLIDLQLRDTTQAVYLDRNGENIPVSSDGPKLKSQEAIYEYLQSNTRTS